MEPARPTPRPQLPKEEAQRLAQEDACAAAAAGRAATGASDPISDIDDLLDEIDAVLEEQAVLANFRQKGGE